jgi:hypothetical protein
MASKPPSKPPSTDMGQQSLEQHIPLANDLPLANEQGNI